MKEASDGPVNAALQVLAIDKLAGDVVGRLEGAGVASILLKGATIAKWLYSDGVFRPYSDVDLLIDPLDFQKAEQLLNGLSFESEKTIDFPGKMRWVARTWQRRSDGATVDIHRSLHGVTVTDEFLWSELSKTTEAMQVGGRQLTVLQEPARLLHIALHAGQHGLGERKPLEDLRRACAQPIERWDEAARLADKVGAIEAFSAGLNAIEEGQQVATRLHLQEAQDVAVKIRLHGAPPFALGIAHLRQLEGPVAKLRYIGNGLFPPRSSMATVFPLARRGPFGLVLAYLQRLGRILRDGPRALITWWKARR